MVAPLVPQDRIPELAAQVDSAEQLNVLQRLERENGVIMNGSDVDANTASILERLTAAGLVDPGYADGMGGSPHNWIITGNGRRVLEHIERELPRLAEEEQERADQERINRSEWLK